MITYYTQCKRKTVLHWKEFHAKLHVLCSTKITTLPSDPDWQERGYSFSLLNTSSENVKAPYVSILHLFVDLNLKSSFSFAFTELQFILSISKHFTENGYTLFKVI